MMKWFEGSIVLRAIRRLIGRSNQSWRAVARRTPNWAVGLLTSLAVAGLLAWRLTGLQPQKAQAVGEISEARLFQKSCAQDPLANRYAGIHTRALGFGVCIYDADTGQECVAGEVPQTKFACRHELLPNQRSAL